MSARQRRRRQDRRRRHSLIPRRSTVIAAGGLTAGATLALSAVAQAAPQTFTVGSLDDTTGASDCAVATNVDCTLRQAIIDANNNSGVDAIVFASGLTGTITLTSAPEPITEGVTIDGASRIAVSGDGSYRVFYLNPATANDPVSLSGLVVLDGYSAHNGGAIFNYDASLTVSNSVIRDSTAYGYGVKGGGVYSQTGSVTINSSTVSGNYAGYPTNYGAGGGIFSYSGNVAVTDSTISGNTAASHGDSYGGGINADNGNVTIDRSTIYNNDAAYDGGGLYLSNGNLTVTNSTITGNRTVKDDGGGVYVGDGALKVVGSTVTDNYAATAGGGLRGTGPTNTVQNSIVSGNRAPNDTETADLAYGTFDVAFSLIGVPADHVNATVPGSNILSVAPQLGGLADNGGPTETQLPADTSPVIDKGAAFGQTSDQRGLTRPVEIASISNSTALGADGSDIGAVEVQSVPAPPGPPVTPHKKKKCKKHKKHKRSADSAKKKKCKKHKKKH